MNYIIHESSKDWGCGHQIKNQWTAQILAKIFDLQCLQSNLFPGRWQDWDKFLNFNESLPNLEEIERTGIELKKVALSNDGYDGTSLDYFKNIIEPLKNDNNILFVLIGNTRYLLYQIEDVNIRNEIVDSLRKKYDKAREKYPISVPFDKNKINVAVHIRRGDIAPGLPGCRGQMFVNEQYFINVMTKIKQTSDKEVKFRIYSCGQDNFNLIRKEDLDVDYDFSLNLSTRNEFEAFHYMLNADILIASPSNFSYIIGEMSGKIVINLSRIIEHPAQDYTLTTFSESIKKIEADESGNFDTKKLKEFLR